MQVELGQIHITEWYSELLTTSLLTGVSNRESISLNPSDKGFFAAPGFGSLLPCSDTPCNHLDARGMVPCKELKAVVTQPIQDVWENLCVHETDFLPWMFQSVTEVWRILKMQSKPLTIHVLKFEWILLCNSCPT